MILCVSASLYICTQYVSICLAITLTMNAIKIPTALIVHEFLHQILINAKAKTLNICKCKNVTFSSHERIALVCIQKLLTA